MFHDNKIYYFNTSDKNCSIEFGNRLYQFFRTEPQNRPLIFLCIGSDRATGDCLGPLLGQRLQKSIYGKHFTVYGSLNNPVHAKNLPQTLAQIHRDHTNPLIIAVDASLGKTSHIGYFTLCKGSLKPGAGIGKELPEVGDYCITGIVNLSGILDQMLLQTTPLNRVMTLSDKIYDGICYFIYRQTLVYASAPQALRQ